MNLIVRELTVQDTETGRIYRTGDKYNHSLIANDIEDQVARLGSLFNALHAQILEDTEKEKHVCNPSDKYCTEGANPYRHPDHDSHITGCNCEKGNNK